VKGEGDGVQGDHLTGKVRGKLVSTRSTKFTIGVFASGSCDPSGHGEARTFLGSVAVDSNAKGVARFVLKATAAFAAGSVRPTRPRTRSQAVCVARVAPVERRPWTGAA